eukprot:25214-Chlamydomonas_euryale.AAC.1
MLARHPEPARDELEDMLLGLRKTLAQVDDESGGNGASIGTSTGSSGRRGEMDVGSGSDGSGGGGGGSEHVVRDPDGAAVVRSPDDGGRADGLLQSGSGGTRLDPAARDAARRLGAADGDVAAPDVHGGARHLRPAGGGDGRDGDDGRGGDDVTASLREDDDLLPRVRGTRRSGKRGGGGGSSGVPMSAVLLLAAHAAAQQGDAVRRLMPQGSCRRRRAAGCAVAQQGDAVRRLMPQGSCRCRAVAGRDAVLALY